MLEPLGTHEHGYTCREVVELATELIEGTLPPHERTLFELHLNFCDGCFTFIDQIRETTALASRLDEDLLPEQLKGQLVQAFRDWKRA
jgi:Putative zinc-finger